MNVRVLPPEEYGRIAHTEAGPIAAAFLDCPAVNGKVYVAEEGDVVVGTWTTFEPRHVEGLWIDPYHVGRAGFALLKVVREHAKHDGFDALITASISDRVSQILNVLKAVPIDAQHFSLPVER